MTSLSILVYFHMLLHVFVAIKRNLGVVMQNEERWVNVENIAAHIGVGKDSIYRWINTRGFPAHRVGRLYRFKISEVDEWVRKGVAEKETSS